MPTDKEIKEAYRLFFLVKGHLDTSPETALASADGYFKRLWYAGGNGAPLYEYEEQFELAWSEHMACKKMEELSDTDLDYIEDVFKKEFTKQNEYNIAFKSKNSYTRSNEQTQKITRIMDAIRSEKVHRRRISEKW